MPPKDSQHASIRLSKEDLSITSTLKERKNIALGNMKMIFN